MLHIAQAAHDVGNNPDPTNIGQFSAVSKNALKDTSLSSKILLNIQVLKVAIYHFINKLITSNPISLKKAKVYC